MLRKLIFCAALFVFLSTACSAQTVGKENSPVSLRQNVFKIQWGKCLKAVATVPLSILLAILNRYDILLAVIYIVAKLVSGSGVFGLARIAPELIGNVNTAANTVSTCFNLPSSTLAEKVTDATCLNAVHSAGNKIVTSVRLNWTSIGTFLKNLSDGLFTAFLFLVARLGQDFFSFYRAIIDAFLSCNPDVAMPGPPKILLGILKKLY